MTRHRAVHRSSTETLASMPSAPMPAPLAVTSLLMSLRLHAAPRSEQRRGISDWLDDHAPTASLTRDLQAKGYADLLS